MLYHHGKFNISVSNKFNWGAGGGGRRGKGWDPMSKKGEYSQIFSSFLLKKNFFEKLFLMEISTLLKVIQMHVITAKLLGYNDKVEHSCKIGTRVHERKREFGVRERERERRGWVRIQEREQLWLNSNDEGMWEIHLNCITICHQRSTRAQPQLNSPIETNTNFLLNM
jgi:hypothetical protein